MDSLSARVTVALPPDIAGTRLLVAVSGGADSVALLRVLHGLQQTWSFEVVVAHLNHGLRGAESDADARWVEMLSRELDVPCVVETVDVAESAARLGGTIEETARNLRYDFFKRTARSQNCRFVAVAHTADDQTETVLHHILRGTGLAGLQGMPERRSLIDHNDEIAHDDEVPIELIRPLLRVDRAIIEVSLHEWGQDCREDASNTDERFTRNRIRHVLLPLLRERFNPQVADALLRLSRQAKDAQDALDDIADGLLKQAVREESSAVCRLDCKPLRECSPAVVRGALVRLWQRVGWPRQKMGFREWDYVAQLVLNEESETKAMTLPGSIDARRRGDLLILRRETSAE